MRSIEEMGKKMVRSLEVRLNTENLSNYGNGILSYYHSHFLLSGDELTNKVLSGERKGKEWVTRYKGGNSKRKYYCTNRASVVTSMILAISICMIRFLGE